MSSKIKQFENSLLAIKNRFWALQRDLILKEDYIKYLEKAIIIRDDELDPLRQQITDIKKRLQKALQTSESQEKYIDYLEKQLFASQLLNRRATQQLERQLQQYHNHGTILEYWRDQLILRYEKWKNKTHGSRQIINNLNQQIFALQNNPLVNPHNMAALTDVTSSLAPMIAQIPIYIGQEPLIEYYNKFILAERFISSNPFQNNAGNQVNTPTLFLDWLEDKYREVMIGTSQASMKALINEKFSPLDIPDSYKQRIRTFTHSIADADCLPILYNHLPENLEL
ncbi:1992_t:CDS:2 [Ambispora gerdemannii]|uniref:1992_t:CDS:1 n=1 Tax=Ambispora gerdemannii TaxID=144530 RepID=A0A9N9DGF2_9GLOM|nr:1992_t:CDS:2 [Ambispora gerdemannii]